MQLKLLQKLFLSLENKLTGNAIRVPTPNVSLAVLVLNLNEEVNKSGVNTFLRDSAFRSEYRKILGFVNSSEIVSTDFYSSEFASVIDASSNHCRW